jgi:ATP-dependent Clp protease ATP-binding subunit ClpA
MVSELTVSNSSGYAPELLDRLRGLRPHLATKIRGQEHILDRAVSVFTRGELGFAHPRRPRGSFLLVGPTGVGKTETTNVFTNYLFTGAVPIRFDMSEYQNQVAVEKLIGENRNDPGLLGRALRRVDRGTLLFDEIEKAHPLVLDLFLQMLEDARITLATGEVLDLRPFYITYTSNIGSEETIRMESAPFASIERTVLMRVRERLRPELLGRINEILVFARLGYSVQREICENLISHEVARFAALGYHVEAGTDIVEFLVRQGYHRSLGARPMRGAVERFIQDAVASGVIEKGASRGRLVVDDCCSRLALSAERS